MCKLQSYSRVVVILSLQLIGCASYPQKNDYLACDLSPITVDHKLADAKLTQSQELTFDPICTGLDYLQFKNIDALVISGGAADGAFGAGFISELLSQNKMAVQGDDSLPHPCAITGVSTGALMSPFVYLATSLNPAIKEKKYHERLRKLYPEFDDDNLLSPSSTLLKLRRLLFSKSLFAPDKIKAKLESELDDSLIKDLVKEYRSTKRKIYIGTTNVNSGNFEIIDLTRLFEKANPQHEDIDEHNKQCAFAVIRGSTSIPIAFEPVPIKDGLDYKLFVDGGIRYPLFLNYDLIKRLREVNKDEGSSGKTVRVFTVINHLDQVLKNDPNNPPNDTGEIKLENYINNFAEITRNQLYLDATLTLSQLIKQNNIEGYWVDATSAKSCTNPEIKPLNKYFHKGYQQCLVNYGELAANNPNHWLEEPNLLPAIVNNK